MEEKAQKAKVQVRYTHNDGVIMYVCFYFLNFFFGTGYFFIIYIYINIYKYYIVYFLLKS